MLESAKNVAHFRGAQDSGLTESFFCNPGDPRWPGCRQGADVVSGTGPGTFDRAISPLSVHGTKRVPSLNKATLRHLLALIGISGMAR